MISLHPKVKEAAEHLISLSEQHGINVRVIDTLRSAEYQEAIYAQGRKALSYINKLRQKAGLAPLTEVSNTWATNAKSSKLSYHGYGLAFDIGIIDSCGVLQLAPKKVDWNSPSIIPWLTVARLSTQINGVSWGGTFSASPDISHYQMTFGLTITDLLKGIQP